MLLPSTGSEHRRRGRMAPLLLLFTLLFVILEARLFYLQIVRGADFANRRRIEFPVEKTQGQRCEKN